MTDPAEGLPKSDWCVNNLLVVPAAPVRRANSFRNRNEFPVTITAGTPLPAQTNSQNTARVGRAVRIHDQGR